MTDPDPITELVDWQLSQRRPVDEVTRVCRFCRSRWQSGPLVCPECGTQQ